MRVYIPWRAIAVEKTCEGQDYKAEYTLSTVVPVPFPWGLAAERWAELVAERSGEPIGADLVNEAEESVAKR